MSAEQPSTQQVMGFRIRQHREQAGLSQAELARRVYVSRQTVGNWESGRTLADVQSLALLAQAFGTTVDNLIGREGLRAERSTVDERHTLVRLLAASGALLGATLLLVYAAHLIALLTPQGTAAGVVRIAMDVAALACELVLLLRALPRLRAFMRAHDLKDAAAGTAYLEGRNEGDTLPNDPLFRWFIPYWKLWLTALVAMAFIVTTLYVGAAFS